MEEKKISFDKDLIDKARRYFYKVYIDIETPESYYGYCDSKTYDGHRVRIYRTSWDYENAEIIHSNEELEKYINEYEKSLKEEYGEDWKIYA